MLKSLTLVTSFLLGSTLALSASPIINEIVASNRASLADEDGAFPDWIELYNPDSEAYDLDGHFLTDDVENLERWQFPEVSIPANGYLIIFASSKDRRDEESELHTNFGVSADGEYVALIEPDGQTEVSSVQTPPLDNDQSYAAIGANGSLSYEVTDEPTPNGENVTNVVQFSIPGQAFTGTLTLELSTPGDTTIRYTEDGRKPTLFNGKSYDGPITIDRTMMINALTDGGASKTETFIKIAPELAERDSGIPLVIVDTFGNTVAPKESSMTDMAIGFQDVDASGKSQMVGLLETNSRGGIRKRGQSSGGFAKFPMRLELWNDENDDEDAKEGRDRDLAPLGFPTNSDFILNARYTFDRALIRNTWIMELSNQIGRYAVRTRHVELYLNDDGDDVGEEDYFGVYTFMETVKRDDDRVDVPAMAATATEAPEITGGYVFKKDKNDPGIWQFTAGGVPVQMVYPTEEGRSERGHQQDFLQGYLNDFASVINNPDPVEGYPAFIDVGSWIDHHWLNVIPLNVDAMRISGYFHKERDSEEGTGKVHAGPIWDYDRSAGSTDGRTTDPELWRGRGGDNGTHFFRAALGEPRWWQDLFEEQEFLQQWVDRYHALRHEELVSTDYDPTPLPPFSNANIARIIEHQGAVLGEAGDRNFERWGPVPPRGHAGEIDHLRDWMETRMDWIDSELVTTPTYTPTEDVHNGPISITLKAPPSSLFNPLVVYYTTDGSDPRAVGGAPAVTATKYGNKIELTESATIFARKFDEGHSTAANGPEGMQWSAIGRKRYFIGEEPASANNVIVTEVMYNPADPTAAEEAAGFDNNDDFEFIELLNIGDQPVSFYEARLRGGADYDFPEALQLAPGQRVVLASNVEAFKQRYGTDVPVYGQYADGLTNSGDRITLRAYDGSTILEFTYSDDEPWPADADGEGKSLVLKDTSGAADPTLASSWAAGAKDNGTPGTDESGQSGGEGPGPGDPGLDWLADTHRTLTADIVDGALTVTYHRPVELAGIDIAVEVSNDLQTWEASAAVEEVSITPNGDGTEAVLLRDAQALTTQGAQFLRLHVTQQ